MQINPMWDITKLAKTKQQGTIVNGNNNASMMPRRNNNTHPCRCIYEHTPNSSNKETSGKGSVWWRLPHPELSKWPMTHATAVFSERTMIGWSDRGYEQKGEVTLIGLRMKVGEEEPFCHMPPWSRQSAKASYVLTSQLSLLNFISQLFSPVVKVNSMNTIIQVWARELWTSE